jgi:Protein of unknown function DUF262
VIPRAAPYDGIMPVVTKPAVDRVRPAELVDLAMSGRIRIPPFQRPFRWDGFDVERLFDSIYRGYPIGNLLMWERRGQKVVVQLGPLAIDAPEVPDALWVVDGQQRVTSLVGTLALPDDAPDPRFRVFFDLRLRKFVSAGRREQVSDSWLPMPVALRNQDVLRWQRERPWLTEADMELCDGVVTAIRDYEIPMYIVRGDDERALREIFDRLNTFGKRLRREEVFEALHAVSPGMEPSGLRDLGISVRAFGFGDLPEPVLMQSVLAIRGPRVDRDFRNEFVTEADRHQAFVSAENALGHVIDFLRDECGIPHQRLVPYALYIPLLARYVAMFGAPEGHAAELLRRWVWRGSVVGPTPEGNTVALRRYAAAIDHDALTSATRLLELLPASGKDWEPDLERVRMNSARGKLNVLALLAERPKVLAARDDGAVGDAVDIQGIMERGGNPLAEILPHMHSLAARLIHPPLSHWDIRAAIMYGDLGEDLLRSQCLDQASRKALVESNRDSFLSHRGSLMRDVIKRNVQRYARFGFRDGPDPALLFDAGGEAIDDE